MYLAKEAERSFIKRYEAHFFLVYFFVSNYILNIIQFIKLDINISKLRSYNAKDVFLQKLKMWKVICVAVYKCQKCGERQSRGESLLRLPGNWRFRCVICGIELGIDPVYPIWLQNVQNII